MDGRGLLAAVTLSAAVAWSAPTAVTNRLTQVLSGTDGDQQTLAATNWTDGCVVHAGADYLVDLTSPFRLPASTPLVFGGNSLQLGTDQKQAFVVSKGVDVTFENDGLFLKNVRWDHWQGGYRPSFHGRVTVLSRQSNPVRFVTGTAQAAHTFTGPWFATTEKGVWVSASEARAKGHTLQLTGDLSGFAGRFRVTSGAVLELGTTELPGEILLEADGADGLGAGVLSTVETESQVGVNHLTLGAGGTLAFKVAYVPRTTVCTNNGFRVTGRLLTTGTVLISVPRMMTCLATAQRQRFPFLVRAASAEGSLKVEDFALAEPVDGVSLEVARDPSTGEQTLFVVLESSSHATPRIAYEDFGAVGDGKTDDQAAIVAAHAMANQLRLPVRARDDAVYYIGGAAETAQIKTDVDWGRARFIIDDTAVSNRSSSVFRVAPSVNSRSLAGPAMIRRGERTLGIPVDGPAVVVVKNANKKHFIREGKNQNDGTSQTEVYLVDARGVVDASVPMTWDFDAVTSCTVVPVDTDRLTVKGGLFTTIANQEESTYNYFSRGIAIQRSNVRIQGLRHDVVGEGDHGAPYGGFLKIDTCANVEIADCVLTAHKIYKTIGNDGTSVSMGTYDISVSHAVNVLIRDCRQTTDIMDTAYWGVHTSNFCKNMTMDGCVFSRFDDHQGIHNATILNSTFGHQGIRGDGWGVWRIENCEVKSAHFLELRSDYGSTWTGEVVVRNCRLSPPTGGKSQPMLLTGSYTGFHDFGYPCRMPWRITVDGLTVDDFSPYSSYRGPYLFSDFTKANTNAAFRAAYPFEVPERVILRNIKTTSGKTFQKSPNEWMFRTVAVTNETPADCTFTVADPVLGWNATNATFAVNVTAFDATVATNARLVVTVRDVAGTVVDSQARDLTGTGVQTFRCDLPTNNASYSYQVEVVTGEDRPAFVASEMSGNFFAGEEVSGETGFCSRVGPGGLLSTNGAWRTPPVVFGERFRVDREGVFDVSAAVRTTNRLIRVESDYEVDALLPFEAYAAPAGIGSLAASQVGGRAFWRGVRSDAEGRPEWFTLLGQSPTSNVVYRVRVEADFTGTPPCVRYAVKAVDEEAFVDLVDGEGQVWHPCADPSATTVSQIAYTGFGEADALAGTSLAAVVAEVAGVRYADFNGALSAAAEKGQPLTLLLDVAVLPDRATGGAEVVLGGHRLSWSDTDGWGIVYDAFTQSCRMVKVPAGGFPNGLSSYESYALGLDAFDAESKPLLGIHCSDVGDFIVALNVRPPTEMEGRIRYRLESSASPDFASSELGPLSSSPVFTLSPTASRQFFRVQIVF